MMHPGVTRAGSTHYHPQSPETRDWLRLRYPGYWLLIVTRPRPRHSSVTSYLSRETLSRSIITTEEKMRIFQESCCVHRVELDPISNISKSCETHEKLWKFCERLDLLVKKMVRGRFADIWEDLMGFLEIDLLDAFAADKPMVLATRQGIQ